MTEKPWYAHKKLWLAAIALALAMVQAFLHRGEQLTPEQLDAYVMTAATYLIPLMTAILAFAHVDANSAKGQAAVDLVKTLSTLNKPDATAGGVDPGPVKGPS